MKALLIGFCAAAAIGLTAPAARAQYASPPPSNYSYPAYVPVRTAPDMCGPYYYYTNGCTWYGPNYNVNPPFPPVGGVVPTQAICQIQQKQQQMQPGATPPVAIPYNPWTRSPRDFFMFNEAQQDLHTRQARPPYAPY
jgi:hypothetical protein